MLTKEKLMPKAHICHLPVIMTLFCTGVHRPGQAEALQRYSTGITELGGRL
jgi:hypothetical protein